MDRLKKFLFKNTGTKQTITKNTFWLFFGEILGRVLKFGVVVFATRVLGVTGWGTFSYALAFVSFFYMFADIGINTFITRELSKDGPNTYRYLSAAFVLKVCILLFSFIVSILLIPHIGSVVLSIKMVFVIALLNFSDFIREFALSINRALQKMEREAFIKIIMNGTITILGIALLLIQPNALSLAIAYATGSIIASALTIGILLPELRHVQWRFPLRDIKEIFNFSWPYIATVIFSAAIVTIDSIMLGTIKSTAEVGLYTAAQRIVQFLAIIPVFIGISLFPLMSKNEKDVATSKNIFEKSMVIVLGIAIPIVLGGFLLSQNIMTLLFGSGFAQAGPVLAILIFALLADFPYIILNNVIAAKNLQRKFIVSTIVGLAINIACNIYLIPKYGAVGAALSTVVAQMFIMTMNWQLLKRFFSFSIIPKLGKIFIASVLMMGVVYLCVFIGMHLVPTILVAMASYLLILFVLREPSVRQVVSIITPTT